MDVHTLAVCNFLFLCLYALTTLVYRTMYRSVQPGLRGCDWFIAANLILAVPLLSRVHPGWLSSPGKPSFAMLLAVVGYLPLHRAFAELLERKRELWRLQISVAAIGMALWLYWFYVPGAEVNGWSMTLVTGTQYGLTGLMLIHVADGVERTAGWFAGAICIAFASWNFVWYGMTLSTLGSMVQTSTYLINPGIRLVMNGGLALGFLMIAMSRLQVYLQRETERDELTGLMNLRGIRRAGALTIAECRRARNPISLLMIDLDGFKSTNDRLGHDAGDVLLCAVAKALVEMLRRKDKVARLGGDEFCLMLPETDEREAVQIAERCRSELHEMAVWYHGQRLQVSACFGVAHSADCTATWGELVSDSDIAMYQAKREGGNRVAIVEKLSLPPILLMWEREPLPTRADHIDATGSIMRSSVSETSFWTKGSA